MSSQVNCLADHAAYGTFEVSSVKNVEMSACWSKHEVARGTGASESPDCEIM